MAEMCDPFPKDVFYFRLWDCGPGLQLKSPRSYWPFSKRTGVVKPIIGILGWGLFYLKPLPKGDER